MEVVLTGDVRLARLTDAALRPQRVIKRYSNRKLYDTRDSRYVTLLEVADLIRSGQDVRVIDNGTKEDKTDVTLALILSEELKARPRGIPRATLKALVRSRGSQRPAPAKDSMIDRVPPPQSVTAPAANTSPSPSTLRGSVDPFEQAVDARIREILPDFNQLRDLQAEVKRIAGQLADLERRLCESPPLPEKTSE